MSTNNLSVIELRSFFDGNIFFRGRQLAVYQHKSFWGRMQQAFRGTREAQVTKRIEIYQTKGGQYIEYSPFYLGSRYGSWKLVNRKRYLKLLASHHTTPVSYEFVE